MVVATSVRTFPTATPRSSTTAVLPGNQVPLRGQPRVRSHEGVKVTQHHGPRRLCFSCQSSALIFGKPDPLAFQRLSEYPVFFLQIFYDVKLLSVDPPSQGRPHNLSAMKDSNHDAIISTRRKAAITCDQRQIDPSIPVAAYHRWLISNRLRFDRVPGPYGLFSAFRRCIVPARFFMFPNET